MLKIETVEETVYLEVNALEGYARKEYVDDAIDGVNSSISNIESNVSAINSELEKKADKSDIEGLATERYVDDKVSSIDLSEYALTSDLSSAIELINSDLDLKADKTELEGLATEDYVNERIGEKEIGITEPELISKSVGSGKWMREGAYGVGGTTTSSSEDLKVGTFGGGGNYTIMRSFRSPNAGFELRNFYSQDRFELRKFWQGAWNNPVEILHSSNTRADKNNVLHSGTGTPLNTLNVSDMAQEVVDRDDITVTSGAVYRAIAKLQNKVDELEGQVNELKALHDSRI